MKRFILLSFALVLSMGVMSTFIRPSKVTALSGNEFRAGRIIDDLVFFNTSSMSAYDIQQFLNAKIPVCDRYRTSSNPAYQPPYTCLNEYQENTDTRENNYGRFNADGSPYQVPGGKPASRIIWDASIQHGINPQVLIIMLQKEQSLITDNWPWKVQYDKAMGYACPDTAACDTTYYGFYNQVNSAARQLRRYVTYPDSYNFKSGVTRSIRYSPSASCGSGSVFIETAGTAALYNYTPYQPNQAALNNLYGTGDGCSAYGNRNFWRMFRDWFGLTYANDTIVAHPNGTLISNSLGIFLIDNGVRRHIQTATIFESYGYSWGAVKKSTTGDNNLPFGPPIDTLAPGSLIYTKDSPLYVMTTVGGVPMKQHISLYSFNILGYSWSDARYIPPNEMPSTTAPGLYVSDRHPAGTLVLPYGSGKLFVMQESTKSHILNPAAFDSNNFKYSDVYGATLSDINTPDAQPTDIRGGTMVYSNGIFLIDYDSQGILKRPVGPWECYSDRAYYKASDLVAVPGAFLPVRTGQLYTC